MGNNPDSPSVRKWTDAEIEYLFEASEQRVSRYKIAEHLGRTIPAVLNKAASLGLVLGKKSLLIKARTSDATVFDPWSEDEKLLVAGLWSEGLTISEIAEKIGRTAPAVQAMRQKLQLPKRTSPTSDIEEMASMYEAGHTLREIGRKYGISGQAVLNKIKGLTRTSRALTEDEIATLEARYQDGCTLLCIANRLGRSLSAIDRHVQTVGLQEIPAPDDDAIVDLKRHGLTAEQISKKLELPTARVRNALRRSKKKGAQHV